MLDGRACPVGRRSRVREGRSHKKEPTPGFVVRLWLIVFAGHGDRDRGQKDRPHIGHRKHRSRAGPWLVRSYPSTWTEDLWRPSSSRATSYTRPGSNSTLTVVSCSEPPPFEWSVGRSLGARGRHRACISSPRWHPVAKRDLQVGGTTTTKHRLRRESLPSALREALPPSSENGAGVSMSHL